MSAKSTLLYEPAINEDQMTLVVKKLYQITRESTLDYAIRVGSLIIHYFYNGDARVWRSRGPKMQSFRRLASHPQLPMSPSTLYRCVAVFELCERLNIVERGSYLTVSHLRCVLRLDERDQRRLISAANAERWSVERMQREVRQIASFSATSQRRQPASELVCFGRSVDKLLRSGSRVIDSLPALERVLGEKYVWLAGTLRDSIRGLQAAREAILERQGVAGEETGKSAQSRSAAPVEDESVRVEAPLRAAAGL